MLFPNDPSDWLSFLVRIKWSVLVLLFCSGAIIFISYVKPVRGKRIIGLLLASGVFLLMISLASIVLGREMLLTLLGSEDDQMAERAYRRLEGKVETVWLLPRINDETESPNVRFYLSRMLATNPKDVESRLNAIGRINPDPITPRFFGLNTLNSDVREIPVPVTTRNVALHYSAASER